MVYLLCLVALSLPLYLLKVKIAWVPTNVLELMILIVALVWLVRKIMGFRIFGELRKQKRFLIPSLLILIGVIIGTLSSANLENSAGILKGWFLAPMVFALILVDVIKSKKQLKNFLAALFISGAAVAAVAFWYFIRGSLTYDERLSAFYLSPNHLAMYLAPIFIIGFGLWFLVKKRYIKALLLIANCLLLFIIYLTYSYGAWLGIVGALVMMLALAYRRKKFSMRNIAKTILLLLLLIIILLISQLGTEKFNNLLKIEGSSLQSRLMVWRSSLMLIKDYPILGIGPGMFQKYYLAEQARFSQPYLEWAVPQPHNIFLAFWLQAGLLGIVGFLWLLIVFFKKTLKLNQGVASILVAVMTYIIIHGLIDTTYWKNDLAMIFWIVVALSIIITSKHRAVHLVG